MTIVSTLATVGGVAVVKPGDADEHDSVKSVKVLTTLVRYFRQRRIKTALR